MTYTINKGLTLSNTAGGSFKGRSYLSPGRGNSSTGNLSISQLKSINTDSEIFPFMSQAFCQFYDIKGYGVSI